MRLLSLLGLILLPFHVSAAASPLLGALLCNQAPNTNTGGSVSPLFTETFEGSEYDLSWTEESNPNGDYDNTGKGMEGSQAFNSTADGSRANHTFTAQAELWIRFQFWAITLPAAASWASIYFDSPGTFYMTIGESGAGRIRVYQGSTAGTTTAGMSAGALYYIWLHYKTDGTGSVEFSTSSAKTGSGSQYATITGDSTGNLSRVYIGLGAAGNIVLDKLQVWTSDPGNDPP